jgi:DNA-directed RNA polymerase subunit RPC12/RpoP
MNFPCTCKACGRVNQAEWSQIGQELECGGCGTRLTVPAPSETAGGADVPPAMVRFRCPGCGRKFATKAGLAGKKVRCSGCGAGVRVPQAIDGNTVVAEPSQSAFSIDSGGHRRAQAARSGSTRAPDAALAPSTEYNVVPDSSSVLDALAAAEGVNPSRRAGTVLTSRSELMESVRQNNAVSDSLATEEKTPQPTKKKGKKKKKRKNDSFFDPKETLKLVAGVGAFVAVLAFLAWGYPELRFPLGGFLAVLGFIVYLLGAVSIRRLVAEEGVLPALLFRFCPPYQWWFVARNWADTRDFVAFFVAGMVVMSLGGAIIKVSPQGRRADRSERAFQKTQRASGVLEAPPSPLQSARAADVDGVDD